MAAPGPPRRAHGHRRSLSLGALPLVIESAEPEDDALGLLARRTVQRAQRYTVSRQPAPDTVPEEPSMADEGDEENAGAVRINLIKPSPQRDPLVGLGIGVPQTAAPGGSFSAARGSRNRLTIQAALGNLRHRQSSAPGWSPLSACAPTFTPRGIATPSPRSVSFAELSRAGHAPSVGQRTLPRMPSLEQIAACVIEGANQADRRRWKRSKDEAAGALIEEWPESVSGSPVNESTPDLDAALDSAPSSPDEPKGRSSVPPTPTIVNHDRVETGRKLLTTLERRRTPVTIMP